MDTKAMNTPANGLNRILAIGFMGFSLAYLLTLGLRPYAFSWVVKTIPICSLVVFAFFNIPGKKGKLMTLGFFFSCMGDVLLELDGWFEAGMGAFILAHLFYIPVFLNRPGLRPGRLLIMGIMVAFSLGFGWFLFPFLGPMMIPIYVYLGVISLMGVSVCLGQANHGLVILGAGLFIISDSLIAYTMFVSPVFLSSLWVMATYYAAQALLGLGVAKALGSESAHPAGGVSSL